MCGSSLKRLQASNCQTAITDNSLKALAAVEDLGIEFLDISYNKLVTDEGLKFFEGKSLPLVHLIISGLGADVTSVGLAFLIQSANKTLRHLEAALMRQEGLRTPEAEWGKAIGTCFELEYLDVSGCRAIDDGFFHQMHQAEKQMEDGSMQKPGLINLRTVNVNFLVLINPGSVHSLMRASKDIENLEIAGCELFQEYDIEKILTDGKALEYINFNHIPVVNAALFEQLKEKRPDLLVRQYRHNLVDPKDNMLRVPLRIAGAKKAKKKKGKGKGKKKK